MDAAAALDQLQAAHSLSILSLAEPILREISEIQESQSQGRSAGGNGAQVSTPAMLSAELAHYQELFSKLRFSYVEQVTKERFLRAITAAPPEFVTPEENAELEAQLREEKAALKAKKQDVREVIEALEAQGRQLSGRYEQIQLRTAELESLPSEITNLEATIASLQQQQEPTSSNPDLSLPLQPTLDLLYARQQELDSVDIEIQRLQAAIPAKRTEAQRLQDELAPLQLRKIKAVEEAQEARRRRAHGGMADELEERGRWLRGVETSLKAMLEV